MAGRRLDLPVVDLTSADLRAAAKSICQACVEYGFFYVINHGIDAALLGRVFAESRKFFALPMEEKVALRKNSSHRGYTAPYSEKVDPLPESRGDSKECFYIGLMGDGLSQMDANQWPSIGKRILSLIALSLDLDAEFFHKNGAFDIPSAFLRLLHYSGQLSHSSNVNFGAAAHSDYGMLTLLATDGTPGLQYAERKIARHPQLWEDNHHIDGSTLHRVVPVGRERYSVACFIDPSPNLVVQCMESCCSEANPPRFPPIKSGDYLEERLSSTYKLATV